MMCNMSGCAKEPQGCVKDSKGKGEPFKLPVGFREQMVLFDGQRAEMRRLV